MEEFREKYVALMIDGLSKTISQAEESSKRLESELIVVKNIIADSKAALIDLKAGIEDLFLNKQESCMEKDDITESNEPACFTDNVISQPDPDEDTEIEITEEEPEQDALAESDEQAEAVDKTEPEQSTYLSDEIFSRITFREEKVEKSVDPTTPDIKIPHFDGDDEEEEIPTGNLSKDENPDDGFSIAGQAIANLKKDKEVSNMDVSDISGADISKKYMAFTVFDKDDRPCQIEAIVFPIDASKTESAFGIWCYDYGSDQVTVGISTPDNHGVEKYKLKTSAGDSIVTFVLNTGSLYDVEPCIPARFGRIEMAVSKMGGEKGLLRTGDRNAVMTFLPTDTENGDNGNCDFVYVKQTAYAREIAISENGRAEVTLKDEAEETTYEFTCRWKDGRVYLKTRAI